MVSHGASAPLLSPRAVRLGPNLWAAVFSLMKIVPARHILRRAADEGLIGPRTTIIESTSGTFGLALAIEAAMLGRRLILVSDPAMDARLIRRVRDLGAEVHVCEQPSAAGEYQSVRLAELDRLRKQIDDHFWPRQYDNDLNPDSYGRVAEQLLAEVGPIDALVGPVGSGGSMCGLVRRLRQESDCTAIAVDTPGSVLFGQPDVRRELRGLGNSVMPGNLDHSLFDDVHWCPAGDAYAATRELHRHHTLFQGPTSGASYLVARWWAAQNPDRTCIAVLPDEGTRYLDTVYDDSWLAEQGHPVVGATSEPIEVPGPGQPVDEWSWCRWGRRTLAEQSESAEPAVTPA